ncbi:MAG: HPr family phosphocarrier protein [Candidatus Electrothrix aestuarii]|uniref:HPr family phosphocarrier protein n=1 Tax=Candidatus Electrothrix aestuarii TaxID=3062594 RepID=A0AAU8LQU2_9BACT
MSAPFFAMKTVSWESTVTNPNGIHCRVAERLISVIDRHQASVQIIDQGSPIDCTSILELLSLALVQGSRVRFTAQGPDADLVAAAVNQVLSESEPDQNISSCEQPGALKE